MNYVDRCNFFCFLSVFGFVFLLIFGFKELLRQESCCVRSEGGKRTEKVLPFTHKTDDEQMDVGYLTNF